MRIRGGRTMRSFGLAAVAAGLAGVAPASAQDDGFGRDIPLTVAARQIVPQGYKVEMGPGVDGGTNVSWAPGEWHKKIGEAAASGGYVTTVSGQTVRISRKGADKATKAAALDRVVQSTALKDDDAAAKPAAARPGRLAPSRAEHPERVSHAAARDDDDAPAERAPRRHAAPVRVVRHRAEPGVRLARSEEERDERPAVGPSVSASGFVLMPRHEPKAVVVRAPDEGDGWRPVARSERPAKVARVAEAAPAAPAGFEARKDEQLSTVLQDWAAREGWKVEWKSDYHYKLSTSARFTGDFVQASTELLRSMAEARPQPTAEFFRGNKVLVIDNGSRDETAAASN